MPFLQLKIRLPGSQISAVELALEDLGASAVSMVDAEDDAILEPAVGEIRMWPNVILTALFEHEIDQRGLVQGMNELLPRIQSDQIEFEIIEDQEWTRVWMDTYEPMRFGQRLWVCPSGKSIPNQADQITNLPPVVVELDPGLAFGSGTHATTALCLQWLDELAEQDKLLNKTMLDFGCGSGILAIAAVKLGAKKAIGIDNDPQAIIASNDNAERNKVARRTHFFASGERAVPHCDVVIANILAGTLIDLAELITASVSKNGLLALSGILQSQADEVAAVYQAHGFALQMQFQQDWVRLSGKRVR